MNTRENTYEEPPPSKRARARPPTPADEEDEDEQGVVDLSVKESGNSVVAAAAAAALAAAAATVSSKGKVQNNGGTKGGKKNKKTNPTYDRLIREVNELQEPKITIQLTDLEEHAGYKILSIKAVVTRNSSFAVIFELEDGIVYTPYKYKNYFLSKFFGVDEKGVQSEGVKPDHGFQIKDNECFTPGLYFVIRKTTKPAYPDLILFSP